MEQHEDQKYIEALKNHDRLLIEEIYAKHSGKVRVHITSNGGTEDDAKEVFQQAMIILYRKALQNFVLDRPLDNYLFAICRNKWSDFIGERIKKRIKEKELKHVTINQKTGNINEEDHHVTKVIKEDKQYNFFIEKFKELPPHCQEIIGLSWIQNDATGKKNSLKEIAEMLGRKYGYVRKEKIVCQKKLIQKIKEDPRFEYFKDFDQ